MTQKLHPLYGSSIDDSEIAQAVGLPGGVYEGMEPSITGAGGGAGWTATLGVDTRSGRSLWRTAGDMAHGRYAIEEDAAVQIHIDGPSANPRIDLIVGVHKWVQGPIDSVTMEPTGEYTPAQQPTYVVVKGTAAATPVDPNVPDPWDAGGKRAVILARVRVPVSGAPSIERYADTDLRLEYMRKIVSEVISARAAYDTLGQRIDSLNTATQIQSLSFVSTAPSTGTVGGYSPFVITSEKQYGSAVAPRDANSIALTEPGLYEIQASYRVNQHDIATGSCLSMRLYLVHDGGTPQLLDYVGDTDQQEFANSLYAQVPVEADWTDVYIYIDRAGWPLGTIRGGVKYLGQPQTVLPLEVANGNISANDDGGTVYPTTFDIPLMTKNAIGAITWSIVGLAGSLDGSSEPKVEIFKSNNVRVTWTTAPPSYPQVYNISVQAADAGTTPPRYAVKTFTLTLGAALPLAISTADFPVAPSAYAYDVSFLPLATGGQAPYTWAIVAGADTTLPSAAYSSGTGLVTGTISADGTYKVRLRVTDGAAVQVEKVITITATKTTTSGGGCVPAGTMLETVDGPLAIQLAEEGTVVLAYDDKTLEPMLATVQTVFVLEDQPMAILRTELGELRCSRDHRVWRKEARATRVDDAHWPPVEELVPGDVTLIETGHSQFAEAKVEEVALLEQAETVYHVALDKGHVYVAGGVLAHNKISFLTPPD